jgi:hypothetical protein
MQPSRERDRWGSDEIWRAKYDIAVEQFKAGQIGEDTFRLSLHFLGFRNQELEAEIGLNKPSKP